MSEHRRYDDGAAELYPSRRQALKHAAPSFLSDGIR